MPTSILSLQETSADNWTAKYMGNYGIYTIKIQLKNGKVNKFSCTCPSDGYPCKHIAMITSAIKEKQAKQSSSSEVNQQADIEKILKNLSKNDLQKFVLEQVKYNTALANAVLLEFTHTTTSKKKDKKTYNAIFRKIFENAAPESEDCYDYYYDEYGYDLDELDEWFDKAEKHVKKNNFVEAEAIYKAMIEEYADWASQNQGYAVDYISEDYQIEPFEKLIEMAENGQVDDNNLFEFCLGEIQKSKYKTVYSLEYFYDLMLVTAISDANKQKYIEIQQSLLKNETDKKSYESEKILSRIIAFYGQENQIETAWKIREENLQIDSFRQEVVKKDIEENKLAEAKRLIHEYLVNNPLKFNSTSTWNELLLEIAVKEKDTLEIRRIAKLFLLNRFSKDYYRIYKSTFATQEWEKEMEELIAVYQKESRQYFTHQIADLLVEEKKIERLLDYVTRHCSTRSLESYYKHFVKAYPAETLRLFRLTIEDYTKNNLGREHYEYIVKLMKTMLSIVGGNEVVAAMKANFKTIYKNRRAMMEILEKIK